MQTSFVSNRKRIRDRRSSTYQSGRNGSSSWDGTTANSIGEYAEMNDVSTPRFREKSGKGEIVMNPMSKLSAKLRNDQTASLIYEQPPGNLNKSTWDTGFGNRCTGRGNDGGGWTIWSGLSLVSSTDISNAITETCTRCASQIGRSNTDMWENIAEADKTVALLRSPLASWFKFEKKARIATAGLSAAQAWLVYRYGIKPLVLSVNDVLNNLKKETRPTRNTTRAVTRDTRNSSGSGTTTQTYWYANRFDYHFDRTEYLEVRAMSIDEVIMENQYTYGLATKSLVTLPWELVPYSFVVDWFVNVGDFVGAIAQSFFPRSLGQCYVVRQSILDSRYATASVPFAPSVVNVVQSIGGWSTLEQELTYRVVGLSAPGVVIKNDFRLDSATRIADSLALVGQQVMRAFAGRK